MTRNHATGLARLSLLTYLLLSCAAARACPAQVPPGLSAIAVGSKIVVNGLSMAINQVQGPGTAAGVLDRVEKAWKEGGYEVRRGAAAGWETVSAKGNKCLVTLQLVNRKGVFGYLARSTPAIAAPLTPRSFGLAVPADAKVDSSVASDDDGRKGLVVTMSSSRSLDQLNEFFMRQLGESKWSSLRSHKIVDPANGAESLLVSAQRGRNQLELVMWPEGRTRIVMTVSEAL